MKRWFLAAVLVVLVLAFGFLKQGVHKSSMTEEEQQQAAQEAQKAQADKAPAKKAAVPAASAAPSPDALPAEQTIADPATAKHHITVGWVYENTDVVDTGKLKAAFGEVRAFVLQGGGASSVVIVDLDVPTEDRSPAGQAVTSLGVEVDGQSVYDQNPSEAAPGTLTAALQSHQALTGFLLGGPGDEAHGNFGDAGRTADGFTGGVQVFRVDSFDGGFDFHRRAFDRSRSHFALADNALHTHRLLLGNALARRHQVLDSHRGTLREPLDVADRLVFDMERRDDQPDQHADHAQKS